ncbi:hypothetical protein SAMN04489712_14322 [Thermomonospora echinospora]|uniref:Uncharacterized protein n=1 Tax=Thermomonospora echinospora TaxID=1992 RepID=A0A1H6E8K2_9ACTN|nr:hypothetical protein SAMN04489712_14322 [Thermomonospora echinospora]
MAAHDLLAPDRYAARGQSTQRVFAAALSGCLSLTPAYLCSAELVVPPELIITNGTEAAAKIGGLPISPARRPTPT